MPIEMFTPLQVLRKVLQAATDITIVPEHIIYEFDPEVYFKGIRSVNDKKAKLQKPIKTEFSFPRDGDSYIAAAIIDENSLSCIFQELATFE